LLKQTPFQDATRLDFVADEVGDAVRNMRLLPLSSVLNLFPRQVRDLAREQQKQVQLLVEGAETTADKRILEEIKDPLMHMVRNAIDHGIELPEERERNGKRREATLTLRAGRTATSVFVEIIDDGRGLDPDAIRRAALKRKVTTEAALDAMTPE